MKRNLRMMGLLALTITFADAAGTGGQTEIEYGKFMDAHGMAASKTTANKQAYVDRLVLEGLATMEDLAQAKIGNGIASFNAADGTKVVGSAGLQVNYIKALKEAAEAVPNRGPDATPEAPRGRPAPTAAGSGGPIARNPRGRYENIDARIAATGLTGAWRTVSDLASRRTVLSNNQKTIIREFMVELLGDDPGKWRRSAFEGWEARAETLDVRKVLATDSSKINTIRDLGELTLANPPLEMRVVAGGLLAWLTGGETSDFARVRDSGPRQTLRAAARLPLDQLTGVTALRGGRGVDETGVVLVWGPRLGVINAAMRRFVLEGADLNEAGADGRTVGDIIQEVLEVVSLGGAIGARVEYNAATDRVELEIPEADVIIDWDAAAAACEAAGELGQDLLARIRHGERSVQLIARIVALLPTEHRGVFPVSVRGGTENQHGYADAQHIYETMLPYQAWIDIASAGLVSTGEDLDYLSVAAGLGPWRTLDDGRSTQELEQAILLNPVIREYPTTAVRLLSRNPAAKVGIITGTVLQRGLQQITTNDAALAPELRRRITAGSELIASRMTEIPNEEADAGEAGGEEEDRGGE